jgi:hypothetical protein
MPVGFRALLIHSDLILIYLYLQRLSFEIRSLSEIPGEHEFEETLFKPV